MRDDRFSIYCECADEDCEVELWLTLPEWDAAKARPNRIIVARDHPLAAGEHVVEETDRYVIAEGGTPPI
jgi:hypothetical protein